MEPNLIWRLGSGRHINCWNDLWTQGGTKLVDYATRPLTNSEKFLRVSDIVTPDGEWDLSRVDDILPNDIKEGILKMTPPTNNGAEDRVSWSLTKDGVFSHASAFGFLLDPALNTNCKLFKIIWRWCGP